MFKTIVTIAVLALAGLVALVSCQEHYPYAESAGYASFPHGVEYQPTSQRLKHKLRSLKYDPKVQTGIQAIKPAVGYAASVAQPVLTSALRKANDWSARHGSGRLAGAHLGLNHGAHGFPAHLPNHEMGHHSEFGHHSDFSHHENSVHY